MENHKKIIIAMKKARSSLDRIIDHVEQKDHKKDCFEIMQQNLAVIGLLKAANGEMLQNHVRESLYGMMNNDMQKQDEIDQMCKQIVHIVKTAQSK